MPVEEGEHYAYSVKSKSGNIVSHYYTSTPTYTLASFTPQERYRVVGIRTPGGGYIKGLMPGLTPNDKGQGESVDSSPRASKRVKRHLTPPPVTRLARALQE